MIEFILEKSNKKNDYYKNINASKDSWIKKGSGISGISYNVVVSGYYARVEFQFNFPDSEKNKALFDKVYPLRNEIDQEIGHPLS